MKKALIYLFIAIFMFLIIQPNLSTNTDTTSSRVPENTTNNITTNENATIEQSKSHATICIDAAYGGQETGYSVDGSLNEKDINLTYALKLGNIMELAGYTVVYTRTDDTIETYENQNDSAQARINSALDQSAEYFISIQMNNDENKLTKGYSLFTQKNDTMVKLANKISEKLNILNYSSFVGSDSDHYSNFPILQDEQLPSILIELGYLTNEEDLSKLQDEDVQDKIVFAIAQAFVEVID